MSSIEIKPSVPKKNIPYRKIFAGMIITIVGIRLLWSLPTTRQVVIWLLGSPEEIPLPTLNAPNVIKPETIADIHLLEHWGNGSFYSMAWSPDGRYFAIGTTLGVNLYEAKTFQLLRNISLYHRIIGLVFSPDSHLLAVTAEPGNILIINLADDKIVQQWELEKPVVALTYLKDGTLVCVIDRLSGRNERGILKLLNDRWQTVKILDDDFLLDVAFVPEKQAFVVFYVNSVRLVNPLNGRETTLPYTVPYGGDFVLTHDVLLTVDRDRNLFSAYQEGNLLNSVELDKLFAQPIASPDGSLLATIGPSSNDVSGEVITFWDIPTLKSIRTIWVPDMSPYIGDIVFSPTGDQLAVLASYSAVKIFSTAENQIREILIEEPFSSIGTIAITPEGEIRTVRYSGTTLEILSLPSQNLIDQWYFDEPAYVRLLDDAVTVAVAESYGTIRLYRASEAEAPVVVRGNCCSAFSYNGNAGVVSGATASSGDPVTVAIWQKRFGLYRRWKFYHEGHDDFKVAVSPSGQYVAATNPSRTYLWVHGIESGRQYPALVSQIAFSPDEKYLASASGIVELETGRLTLTELEEDLRYSPYHSTPAFSPDGQILAAEVDGTLRFWQVNNGTLLAKLDDPYFSSYKLIFSSDGTFLVGLGEGSVNVWGITEMVH